MAPRFIDTIMPEKWSISQLKFYQDELYIEDIKQVYAPFWVGQQMSFVKHAVFVNSDAPRAYRPYGYTRYILNRVLSR